MARLGGAHGRTSRFTEDDKNTAQDMYNFLTKIGGDKFAGKIGGSGLDYQVLFIVKKASSPTQTGQGAMWIMLAQ